MIRVIVWIILLGVGIYFAWEAHSVLTWELFQSSPFAPNQELTSSDISIFNSPAVDLAYVLGANTINNLHTYLSVTRVVCLVMAIVSGAMLFIRMWKVA